MPINKCNVGRAFAPSKQNEIFQFNFTFRLTSYNLKGYNILIEHEEGGVVH